MCQSLFGYSVASQRDSGQASIVCRSIASEAPYCRRTLCRIFRSAMAFRVARLSHPQIEKGRKTDAVVAHALVRAVFALMRTQASGIDHSVHKSVNAARRRRAPRCAFINFGGPAGPWELGAFSISSRSSSRFAMVDYLPETIF